MHWSALTPRILAFGVVAGRMAMICVAIAVAFAGIQILRFESVSERADLAREILSAAPAGGSVIKVAAQRELAPWTNRLGFSLRARAHLLHLEVAAPPHDYKAIEQAEAALAAAAPTLSATWLALAEARVLSANMEGSLQAWRMSRLTGGHEGYLMVDRVIYGLRNWSALSAADGEAVAREMIGTMDMPIVRRRYRDALADAPADMRSNVADTLQRVGADRNLLSEAGL